MTEGPVPRPFFLSTWYSSMVVFNGQEAQSKSYQSRWCKPSSSYRNCRSYQYKGYEEEYRSDEREHDCPPPFRCRLIMYPNNEIIFIGVEMTIVKSGLSQGTTVAHRHSPTVHWTVVRDVIGGVLVSGTDTNGKPVKLVVPAYFLLTV